MQTRDNRLKVLKSTKARGGFSYEFRIYKIVTWPCGLWPLEKNNLFIHLRYIIATSTQLFTLATTSTEIYRKCGTVADILDYYAWAVAYFLSFVKLFFIRIHLAKIQKNCYNARRDWANVKQPDLVKIMVNYAKSGKKFYYLQMTFAFIIMTLYNFNPFILSRPEAAGLPMQTICTFNNVSVAKHVSVYLIEFVGFIYLVFAFIGVDVLFVGIAMHLCGQLRVLQKQLTNIGESMCHADCVRFVVSLSKKYSEVVELTDSIEKSFSEIILIIFVTNIFLITSQSVTLLLGLKVNNYFLALKTLQSFPILLIQMFMYCYVGELLKHAFDDIFKAIFNSYWYLLPPKIRRDYLLMIMAQTNERFNLTAGKMIRMNMYTFIQFIKSIVSFFSLLLLMFDR